MTMPPSLVGDIGHQCDRACGRGALRAGPQPDHLADGGGGHPHAGPGAAEDQRRCQRHRGPHRRALWRLAVRQLPRRGRDGAASQALPHARRHLQSAACRDPRRHPAARHSPTTRLPRPRRWRGSRAALGATMRRIGLFELARQARRAAIAAGDRHAREQASTGPPISPCKNPVLESAPDRARCDPRIDRAGLARRRAGERIHLT